MIVDLAVVVNDDLPVLIRERLGSAVDVYDAQADVREAHPLTDEKTIAVGPTMLDGGCHPPQ